MKNVGDAGFSQKRGGKVGSGPPLPDPVTIGIHLIEGTFYGGCNLYSWFNLLHTSAIKDRKSKHPWNEFHMRKMGKFLCHSTGLDRCRLNLLISHGF